MGRVALSSNMSGFFFLLDILSEGATLLVIAVVVYKRKRSCTPISQMMLIALITT